MERIEVITSVQRRRRYTGQEKAQFVAMTMGNPPINNRS